LLCCEFAIQYVFSCNFLSLLVDPNHGGSTDEDPDSELEASDEAEESDASDEVEESDASDEVEESDASDEVEESDASDEAEESDASDEAEDSSESSDEIELEEGTLMSKIDFAHLEAWKPSIHYYDYYVQSTDEEVARQVFPYVKVPIRFFLIVLTPRLPF
jgi:cobalamin biosynthesis protein CobT